MKTKKILEMLNFIAWTLFILLCIQAGVFLFNTFFTLFINPVDSKYFDIGKIDFSSLYAYSTWSFLSITLMMALKAIVEAYMFYLIILIFKTLNIAKPFSSEVGRFILKIARVALFICVISWLGTQYSEWLLKQGVKLPLMYKYFGGADVFLMMGVMLFVIAQVFKRGIEIQAENDLTV
jgi:Protein of unknown function (DUF2975)